MDTGTILWIAATAALDMLLTGSLCLVSFRMGRDVGYRERKEQEAHDAQA